MAMNGTALKATAKSTIFSKLQAEFEPDIPSDLDAVSKAKIQDAWNRIAEAVSDAMIDIVTHIQTNAQVNTTDVVTVTTVMPGTGTAPGTGTGIGTVS